jgi:N-acetylglucosaminyl-diphospho-decaprenol L-rhamnosyltransferase
VSRTIPVAVVVVSFHSRDTLGPCLDSLVRPSPLEIVVVDNASADGSAEIARRRDPAPRVLANTSNVGFARACNQGARVTTAPHVLFLNPDAWLAPGALETMVARLESSPTIGVTGPSRSPPVPTSPSAPSDDSEGW